MNRFLILFFAAIFAFGCAERTPHNQYFVNEQGDSISTDYIIGERRVGPIERGATVSRLEKIYGDSYVKQLKAPSQEMVRDSSGVAIYYVYNEQNSLLMIARTESELSDAEIKSLIIKDERFVTEKGISMRSTVDDLRAAYPDAAVVQYENRYFVFVRSLDLYCRIDESNISGLDSDFISDISIDSLRGSAHFENISVSWNSTSSNILAPQFWQDLLSKIIKWLVYELPKILFIILLFVFLRRMLNFTFKKIKLVARSRVEADDSIDSSEAMKRADTITGILHGVLNIMIWSIFILILLSKFGINIAPILASAGILGLAVGFGAQELVRDFICGFFILLEDQLRTGDMAIINSTMGVVEKIELRTVTLRDSSGVVHIFQNGKINTLSNMTKEWSAIVLEIGVAYKENIDHVMDVMREVGDELKAGKLGAQMLGDIEIWGLDSFADSAVVIKVVIKTRPMQQWRVKREYQRLLKIRFDADGIEIPFPHVTLYTGEQTKPMPLEIRDNA